MEVTKSCIINKRLVNFGYRIVPGVSTAKMVWTGSGWTSRYSMVYIKDINKRTRIEVNCDSCEVKAYKETKGYLSSWKEVKVKRRWIKDIEKYMVIEVEVLE